MHHVKSSIWIILFIQCLVASRGLSQPPITVEEYIQNYKDLAVEEMVLHHIPASITLAQGILESACGNSELARQANNHFGIKCHLDWTGKTFHKDDDEKNECFRKYQTAEASYRDHSQFLISRDRYKLLFDLELTDYKGWAEGLKEAGYATNPRYTEMLIRIIEENGLDSFDQVSPRQLSSNSRRGHAGNQASDSCAIAPETFEIAGRGGNGRVVFVNNRTRFVLARDGDDFRKIADEFGIYAWQVREYNDLGKDGRLLPGDKVYLQRKKARSEFEYHTVLEGETLHSISQDYAIKLGALSRRNDMPPEARPGEGQRIQLR